jgi:hypothetical protein
VWSLLSRPTAGSSPRLQVVIGDAGFDLNSTSVDDLIANNDYRLKVVCVVPDTERVKNVSDLNKAISKFRKGSSQVLVAGSDAAAVAPPSLRITSLVL